MEEIKVLDSLTASKIAAGEVVQQPINVVKELVENALDARATRINIEINGGGIDLIRITDNGKGIEYNQLPLTVERFATSKASTVEDVYNIKSYGFRGEALAAISAVSLLNIKSIGSDNNPGELISDYGKSLTVREGPISVGTQVTVQNLFENLPVRKKFIKSQRANEIEILKFIKQLSLLRPGIEITVIFNAKEVFRTYSSQTVLDLAKIIYGDNRFCFDTLEKKDYKVDVCLSHPFLQRKRRDAIYTGVNGRVIKDTHLVHAITQGYHRLLPANSYPAAVIHIHLPPQEVDVNIHPSKDEVKFKDPHLIYSLVKKAVEKTLLNFKTSNYSNDFDAGATEVEEAKIIVDEDDLFSNFPPAMENLEPKDFITGNKSDNNFDIKPVDISNVKTAEHFSIEDFFITEADGKDTKPITIGNDDLNPLNNFVENDQPIEYIALNQLSNTYILCSNRKGSLMIIDQHVAHERVLFEKYMNENKKTVASVTLFEPVILELDINELEFLNSNLSEFEKFGYTCESFGPNHIKLIRVPVDLLKKNIETEFMQIIREALELKRSRTQDYTLVSLSCRNAIKAGDKLTLQEMQHLVNDLFQTKNPYTCPHGRPIIYIMSAEEIAKKFHRVL